MGCEPLMTSKLRLGFILPFLLLRQSTAGVLTINSSSFQPEKAVPEIVPTFSENLNLFDTLHRFETRGEVTLLSTAHLSGLNETFIEESESSPVFAFLHRKIVLIPLALRDNVRLLCGPKTDYWEEAVCSFAVLCSFKPLAIIQEVDKEKWFYPKRWFSDHGKALMDAHGPPRNCSYFRVNLPESVFKELPNDVRLSAHLIATDASLGGIRGYYSTASIMFFRVIASTVYLGLTVLAIIFLVVRYKRKKLNSVYVLLYVLTAMSCCVLAVVYYTGAFFLHDIRSPQYERLQLTTFDLYLGISCSTDYLSTILYIHTVSKIGPVQPQFQSRKWLIQLYPIMSILGLTGAAINIIFSYMKSIGSLEDHLHTGIMPYILGNLQLAVLVYVWKQIKRVTSKLEQSMGPTDKHSSKKAKQLSPQARLEVQMRFWVKVSAVGTIVTLGALVIFALSKRLSSLMYRIACAVATAGKQTNVFAQLMISQPVRPGQHTGMKSPFRNGHRVAPFPSTQQSTKGQTSEHSKHIE